MWRLTLAMLSLLQVAVLAACSASGSAVPTSAPAGATTAPVSLTIADKGRTISLPVGSEIDVTLQTIGPGQYATPQVSSAAVQFIAASFVTPFVPAGPTQQFRFDVVAAGQATILIQGAGNNPAFQVTVKAD